MENSETKKQEPCFQSQLGRQLVVAHVMRIPCIDSSMLVVNKLVLFFSICFTKIMAQ